MPTALITSPDADFCRWTAQLLEQSGWTCHMAIPDAYKDWQGDAQACVSDRPLPEARFPTLVVGSPQCPKPVRARQLVQSLALLAAQPATLPLTGGWLFDPRQRILTHAQASVALTEKEAAMLQALLEAEGSLTPQALLMHIWGYGEDIATHTLETHAHRLRTKLREAGGNDQHLTTTPEGYQWNAST